MQYHEVNTLRNLVNPIYLGLTEGEILIHALKK